MPLQTRELLTPPPPLPPYASYSPPAVGSITATWIDPTGQQWPLSDTNLGVGWFTPNTGIGGWGAAPVEIIGDPLARGGEEVRHIRTMPRRLTWPLHIHGDDIDGTVEHMRFTQRYRALGRAFTMTSRRGPGRLRVARPDGSSAREIVAYYEDGFGGDPEGMWQSANVVLTLYCPDGYWRDVTEQRVTRTTGSRASFLGKYPRVSSSLVLGDTIVHNPGDVDAWPVWTLTGPAVGLTATSHTTGQMFALEHPLAAGQTITVHTDVGEVLGPEGQPLYEALQWPQSQLWPLEPDDNQVIFDVAGAGAGTRIDLVYHPRYESA